MTSTLAKSPQQISGKQERGLPVLQPPRADISSILQMHPFLEMGKLRHGGVGSPAQRHSASQWQGGILTSGSPAAESTLFHSLRICGKWVDGWTDGWMGGCMGRWVDG